VPVFLGAAGGEKVTKPITLVSLRGKRWRPILLYQKQYHQNRGKGSAGIECSGPSETFFTLLFHLIKLEYALMDAFLHLGEMDLMTACIMEQIIPTQ